MQPQPLRVYFHPSTVFVAPTVQCREGAMPRVVHFEVHAADPARAARFYADLFELWKRGDGVPMAWTPEEVRQAARETLMLSPG